MAPSRRHHTIHMLYQHTSYAQAVAEFIRSASTGSGSGVALRRPGAPAHAFQFIIRAPMDER